MSTKKDIDFKEDLIRAYCYIYVAKNFAKPEDVIILDNVGIYENEENDRIKCYVDYTLRDVITSREIKQNVILGTRIAEIKYMLESLVNKYVEE